MAYGFREKEAGPAETQARKDAERLGEVPVRLPRTETVISQAIAGDLAVNLRQSITQEEKTAAGKEAAHKMSGAANRQRNIPQPPEVIASRAAEGFRRALDGLA